ncbi:MAG: ATP-binding protein [Gemmataceae bacterium]
MFEVALNELARQLPNTVCGIWLTGEADPQIADAQRPPAGSGATEPLLALTLKAVSDTRLDGDRRRILQPGISLPVGLTGLAGCVHSGQAVYVDLGRVEERVGPLAERLAADGATVCFAVPLRAGDRTVGVLQGVCYRPARFNGEQVQLFYLTADLLGPAISNCQLYTRLRDAYENLRVTQQRLVQTEKMRALGELASGMAHEFNNSLCGTLGLIELALQGGTLDGAARQYLESARTCAWDAAQTVRKVQQFARQRPHDPTTQRIDLSQLLRQSIDLIRMKWEQGERTSPVLLAGPPAANALRLEIHAEEPAWVCGDASELRQVITNLAFNAIDAMPDGGVLTLRVWSSTSHVALAVQDTGTGMAEAVRHRLFEPFFSTKGERGNGLGLSVVYGIVQRHGGQLTVESEPGVGTTMTVSLPTAQQAPRPTPAAIPHPAGTARAGQRVLVIDDEDHIRRFLAGALAHLGYEAVVAATAEEGLAVFEREPFDLVLTDLILPGSNGEQVARTVAQRRPHTPVILLTGQACCYDADHTLPEGVSCLLAKPIGLATLASTVARLVPRGD